MLQFWFRVELNTKDKTGLSFIKDLSNKIDTKILFPDESIDPYSHLLVERGRCVRIDLDPEKYDDYEYKIDV